MPGAVKSDRLVIPRNVPMPARLQGPKARRLLFLQQRGVDLQSNGLKESIDCLFDASGKCHQPSAPSTASAQARDQCRCPSRKFFQHWWPPAFSKEPDCSAIPSNWSAASPMLRKLTGKCLPEILRSCFGDFVITSGCGRSVTETSFVVPGT